MFIVIQNCRYVPLGGCGDWKKVFFDQESAKAYAHLLAAEYYNDEIVIVMIDKNGNFGVV